MRPLTKNDNATASLADRSEIYKEQAKCYAALHDYEATYIRIHQYDMLWAKMINENWSQLPVEMDPRYDLVGQ